jgi:putative endonuclease
VRPAARIDARELGRRGERRARWFYRLRGFSTTANVRISGGEIDLVARRGRLLVIAEVKTRQSLTAGEGFDAVDRTKQLQMIKLADAYVAALRDPRVQIRYDVLSLFWTGRRFEVTHFADAFRPVADAKRPWKWGV